MAYPQTSFVNTQIDRDCLIGRRREVVIEHTLRYQLDVLKSTGRYNAFKLQWHPIYDDEPMVPPVPKHLFWDSDVGKWIEGACYFLAQRQLPDIDAAVKAGMKALLVDRPGNAPVSETDRNRLTVVTSFDQIKLV